MLIHAVMKQEHLEWVIESWENHNFHGGKKLNVSRIMQLYFAYKQLLKSPVLCSLFVFVHCISAATKWFAKRDTGQMFDISY